MKEQALFLISRQFVVEALCWVGRAVYVLAVWVAIGLSVAGLAAAPLNKSQQVYDIDIPSLNAAEALNRLAEQTDAIMLFPYNLAESRQANAVVGRYTLMDALGELLRDSGLYGGLSDKSVIQISVNEAVAHNNEDNEMATGETKFSKKVLGLLVSIFAASGTVSGAETEGDGEAEKKEREVEEMTVTGSRIRGAQSASPVTTITSLDIEMAGFATVEELIEKLPQNFGAGATLDTVTDRNTSNNAVGGFVDQFVGGTSVNLRGLGASSTLVLLNGRRMSPSGRGARFTDISGIPVSAIERVEVLTDGASAIYGSDAIGGVINFILRDDYEGAETRFQYGTDSGNDTSNGLLGQTFGKSWSSGNTLFSYEYFQQDNLANIDRDITSTSDLTRFGGTDWRLRAGGNPANINAGGQLFAIPTGQDGTALTSADFDPNAPLNLQDVRAGDDLLPEQERHSAFIHLTQNIGWTELFAEARFSTRTQLRSNNFFTFDIEVPDTNPFFVDPTGTGLNTVTVENYSLTDDLGRVIEEGKTDSFGATLGVRFDIGQNWSADLVGHWSKEEATRKGSSNVGDSSALAIAAAGTTVDTAFNPFGDGSNTNPAILAGLRQNVTDGRPTTNELSAISFNVEGELFELSGGTVQLASGVEFREDSLEVLFPTETITDSSRDVLSVYGEFFFPLVGSSNGRLGAQRLELSLAGRYEDYSDFGDSFNPKAGLVWSPTHALTFKGTYGTSFRAPGLIDLDVHDPNINIFVYAPQSFVDIGFIPFPGLVLTGGNEDLKPEEATTWTVGFEWSPESIAGLSLNMTYFNVDFEDRIDLPFTNFFNGFNDPRFATLLNTNPTEIEALIPEIVNDLRYNPNIFGSAPAEDLISGVLPVDAILDARRNNLARSVVTGVELQLSHDFETSLGMFDIGLNGNYLFDFERAFVIADPLVDEVDTLGRPVDFRARGNVTWSREEWAVTGYLNYVDGYTDNVSVPTVPIDSLITADLTIAYTTGDNRGFLSDTRFSLTTQNLFDEDPPFADTFGGTAYDTANHNALGRFLSIQLNKEW